MRIISLANLNISNKLPFTLIAGPCQMESREHALMMADEMYKICKKLDIKLIYKSSFDKANRSSVHSKRGIGLSEALPIFAEIKEKYNLPILTDVHNESQIAEIAKSNIIDILQIPAFLCRQTDLLKAAAQSNKIINIKKGQFLAPNDMQNIVDKMDHFANPNILLTERGASFGYNNLVSDMRSLAIMAETGCPVIFDATHSVQQPGGLGAASGGNRHFVKTLARAAIAVGVACMLKLADLENFLAQIKALDNITKQFNN